MSVNKIPHCDISMGFNEYNVEIDISANVGEKLERDIVEAKKSIHMITPFATPSLIENLIEMKEKNKFLDIRLIIGDEENMYARNNDSNLIKILKKLIKLDFEIDNNKREKNESEIAKLEEKKKMTSVWFLLLICAVGGVIYYINFVKHITLYSDYLMASPLLLLFIYVFVRQSQHTKIKKLKNANMKIPTFRSVFKFRCPRAKTGGFNKSYFPHVKLYIIDGEKAYLGSANYTIRGLREESGITNIESLITFHNHYGISKMEQFFQDMWNDLNHHKMDFIGKIIYKKEIYRETGGNYDKTKIRCTEN